MNTVELNLNQCQFVMSKWYPSSTVGSSSPLRSQSSIVIVFNRLGWSTAWTSGFSLGLWLSPIYMTPRANIHANKMSFINVFINRCKKIYNSFFL